MLKEKEEFDDILQADFIDHYYNLTLKTVFTIKFFLQEGHFHPDSPLPYFVMKIDSDAYLNLPQLVKELQVLRKNSTLSGGNFILGHSMKPKKIRRVNRNRKSKWWTPKYMFDGHYFPPFVSGSGFVTTRPAAKCLYDTALQTPFFHLEDVFLTGMVAEKCSTQLLDSPKFHSVEVPINDLKETDILWHYLSPRIIQLMHILFTYQDLLDENQRLQDQCLIR